jgi:hypothetical protein
MFTRRLLSAGLALLSFSLFVGCQGAVESPDSADQLSADENELVSLNRNEVAHSGTRLSAQFYELGSISYFAQFQDNTLNQTCQFKRDTAGAFRCLPIERTSIRFSDSACTAPIAVYRPKAGTAFTPKPYFVTDAPQVACDPISEFRWKAYQVGSQVTVTTTYLKDDAGGCFQYRFSSSDVAYSVSEALPTAFVEGQLGYRAAGVRLAEKILFGTDGSRSPISSTGDALNRRYLDLWLNVDVSPRPTVTRGVGDYDAVWTGPQAKQFAFSDSACTSQSVAGLDACGVRPEMVGLSSIAVNAQCNRELQYKRVTSTSASPVYQTNPFAPGCFETQPGWDSASFNTLGQAANAQRYLTGSTQLKGSGRLAWVELQNQDLSQARLALFDRDLGAECIASTDANGNPVCTPFRLSSFSLVYLDAACTTRGIVGSTNTVIPGDPEVASCNTQPVYVVAPAHLGDYSSFVKAVRGPAIGNGPSPLFESIRGNCFPNGSGQAYSVSSVTELPPVALTLVTR